MIFACVFGTIFGDVDELDGRLIGTFWTELVVTVWDGVTAIAAISIGLVPFLVNIKFCVLVMTCYVGQDLLCCQLKFFISETQTKQHFFSKKKFFFPICGN